MTGRRTALVPLDLHTLAQALGLHESQRILTTYVVNDPHMTVVVIEGGEELPESFDDRCPSNWRDHGHGSPWLRPGEIPHPKDPPPQGGEP